MESKYRWDVHSQQDTSREREGDACGKERKARRCVDVCMYSMSELGSGEEGHEAEIALHIHYARLSDWESGVAARQRA